MVDFAEPHLPGAQPALCRGEGGRAAFGGVRSWYLTLGWGGEGLGFTGWSLAWWFWSWAGLPVSTCPGLGRQC